MQTNSQVAVNGGGSSGAGDFLKRGTKRDASDSNLSDFERFEKRLRMLSLRNSEQTVNGNSKVYTPVSNQPAAPTPNGISHANHEHSHEMMHVDDTRDRVYIHDLDAELADIQSDEEQLVFLPDVEKKFSKLPTQVLTGRRDGDNDSQELVLYNVPESLTMEEGHDSVRKAIIESRHRAREKAAEEARQADMDRKYDHSDYLGSMETAHGYNTGYEEEQPDPDAMDIG